MAQFAPRWPTFCLVICTLLINASAAAQQAPAKPRKQSPATAQTFESKAFDRTVTYHLYVPPAYETNPEQRFPVVYWLHGSNGNSQVASSIISLIFDNAIRAERIPPVILVFPDGMRQSMWVNAANGKLRMEDFLVDELVPHIDSTLRTIADRANRMVEGGSMGGYGAARLGFRYPELFGAVSILSGGPLQPVLDPTNAPIVGQKNAQRVLDQIYDGDPKIFRAQSPWQLALEMPEDARASIVVRQIVGDNDPVFGFNQQFAKHLNSLNIPHRMDVLQGIGHQPHLLFQALIASESYWSFFADVFGYEPATETVSRVK
ncbi:MAG: alpha/beta hydrolase-fold protein [Pseudomonadota bacterium]